MTGKSAGMIKVGVSQPIAGDRERIVGRIAARPCRRSPILAGVGGLRFVFAVLFPSNITLSPLPAYSPELNPQENIWDEIREKLFKNYALKSMDAVYDKLEEAALYIERNRKLVKSIASFPYIVKSS